MGNSKFISIALIICAALFYFVGLLSFERTGLAIFLAGLATLFVSVAFNPIALETPGDGFNWNIIPLHAKVLQTIAIICIVLGMVLYS